MTEWLNRLVTTNAARQKTSYNNAQIKIKAKRMALIKLKI